MKNELKNNLDYYIENQNKLVKKYDGRYVVISDKKIVKSFTSAIDAVKYARKNLESGKYIVQLVGPGEENYTQIISRTGFYAR